ncbi:MAG TPA: EthD domain-containing protein [Candidatus Binatia bacterium]|nr:EthD domain-containing protein [Candidatus Binatia bacterium]
MQAIYKYIRLIKRKTSASPDQFKRGWVEGSVDDDKRALGAAPIRRIVKSIGTGEVALGGTEPPFDAMIAVYFDTLADAKATASSAKIDALFRENAELVDSGASMQEMIAEEYTMGQKADADTVLSGDSSLKIIRTVYRRNDLDGRAFKDYWLHNHSKLEDVVITRSPVVRIVATFAVPDGLEGKTPPFDGMVELYFRSPADIRTMFASEIPAMMRKDEENFVQMDAPAIRFIANEFITAKSG